MEQKQLALALLNLSNLSRCQPSQTDSGSPFSSLALGAVDCSAAPRLAAGLVNLPRALGCMMQDYLSDSAGASLILEWMVMTQVINSSAPSPIRCT